MAEARAHLRSLYRSILRELPARPLIASTTPLKTSIRSHFSALPGAPKNPSSEYMLARRQEMDQFVQYLRAQRMYGALLERYNPGMWMDEEERTRLSARRVGMNMPVEYGTKKKN